MRFLADVNAGRAVVRWLTSRGHDVAQTAEEDPRMLDGDVLRRAVEEQRIVVTTDRDFEEMIWREGRRYNGLLRLENLPRAQRLALLEDVLRLHERALTEGAIVIATDQKIRIRRRA